MKKARLAIATISLVMVSCLFRSGPSDRNDIVLATVNDRPVTAAQMDSLAESQNILIHDTTDVEFLKRSLLDSLIEQRLVDIRVDSVTAELESDRDFVNKRRNELTNTILRLMYESEISAKVAADSAEIVQYYTDNPGQFKEPEQVRAAHVLIKTPPPDTSGVKSEKKKAEIAKNNEKETIARTEAILTEAKAGENWDSLAAKYSQDAVNSKKGGDLGYFPRGAMDAPFDSAAFAAQVGDIVGPVKTRFGYHVIKIIDHKPEATLEFNEDVYSKIKGTLTAKKEKELADRFVDSLKTNARFTYNEAVLGQPDSLLDAGAWVMFVNDADTVFEKELQDNFPKYLAYNGITSWSTDDKKNFLNEISISYLLRAAGMALGYYDDPKAIQAKQDLTVREAQLRVNNMLRDLQYQPTEDEVEAYYNQNFEDRYKVKKPLHVQHIIFSDSTLALAVRDSLIAGADFKEMALRYYPGEPEIREVAYDLSFISDEELGVDFFAAVSALDVGEISMPVKTEWGYHLIKLVAKREDKKVDQVRPGIRTALMNAANARTRGMYLKQWRGMATIKINEGLLKKYDFPESLHAIELAPQG